MNTHSLKVGDKIRYLGEKRQEAALKYPINTLMTVKELWPLTNGVVVQVEGCNIVDTFSLNRLWEKVEDVLPDTKFDLAKLAKLIPKGYAVTLLDCGRISILHDESVCSHYVEDEQELLEKLELISRYEAMEWI